MILDLDALQALDAIDRRGSFARAADELGRVPSAITYLIRKLESDLDVLLFDRRGHKAKLTPAGQELLSEGRHLLFAASELQRRVRRVGDGWEVELKIAMDTIIRIDSVFDLIGEFYAQEPGTRIRLLTEVLSGTWEALLSGRADLAIGTVSSAPGGPGLVTGYQSVLLGEIDMVFAVAPSHPLANAREPLAPEVVRRHRVVAVGDTARNLPPVTIGLLGGQDVLTVPTMQAKVAAQVAGARLRQCVRRLCAAVHRRRTAGAEASGGVAHQRPGLLLVERVGPRQGDEVVPVAARRSRGATVVAALNQDAADPLADPRRPLTHGAARPQHHPARPVHAREGKTA